MSDENGEQAQVASGAGQSTDEKLADMKRHAAGLIEFMKLFGGEPNARSTGALIRLIENWRDITCETHEATKTSEKTD